MGADDKTTALEENRRQLRRGEMTSTMAEVMASSLHFYFHLPQDVQEIMRKAIEVMHSSSSKIDMEQRQAAFRVLRATLMPNRGEDYARFEADLREAKL
jgi:hypothetical protein